jgi:16S rRNA (guanine966-N2)-methyltransferase
MTRPTADRTREALFSSLSSLMTLDGARVLDLYAGSGAVGLEAASRGAARVLLVESDPQALTVLRRNVSELGLGGVRVSSTTVERLAGEPADHRHDLVFADPPYALGAAELGEVLGGLERNGWLTPDAVVVIERSSRDPDWIWPPQLVPVRSKRYGEGTLWYGRRS